MYYTGVCACVILRYASYDHMLGGAEMIVHLRSGSNEQNL